MIKPAGSNKSWSEVSFSPEQRTAWSGFLQFQARIMKVVEIDLQQRANLSHAEFEVLLRLSKAFHKRMRVQELAAQSLITRSGVSRVVEKMERKGLVVRATALEDKRGSYVVLTAQGAEVFQSVAPEHLVLVQGEFVGLLSTEELQQLTAIWAKLLNQP